MGLFPELSVSLGLAASVIEESVALISKSVIDILWYQPDYTADNPFIGVATWVPENGLCW